MLLEKQTATETAIGILIFLGVESSGKPETPTSRWRRSSGGGWMWSGQGELSGCAAGAGVKGTVVGSAPLPSHHPSYPHKEINLIPTHP